MFYSSLLISQCFHLIPFTADVSILNNSNLLSPDDDRIFANRKGKRRGTSVELAVSFGR